MSHNVTATGGKTCVSAKKSRDDMESNVHWLLGVGDGKLSTVDLGDNLICDDNRYAKLQRGLAFKV